MEIKTFELACHFEPAIWRERNPVTTGSLVAKNAPRDDLSNWESLVLYHP